MDNKEIQMLKLKEENKTREYIDIPSFVFKDRTLSVLEVMVEYLKDNKHMKFHEIAVIINRDDRTVWTVYRRAKLKRKGLIKRGKDVE
jgi:predicted transcriptional regulator